VAKSGSVIKFQLISVRRDYAKIVIKNETDGFAFISGVFLANGQ